MSQFTFIVRCLLIFAGVAATTTTARTEEKPRPDIVFIIVDDLNDWIGCLNGHPDAKSPNLDALAASGMLFSTAYCNSPQCRPSRTSLNHGVYPFKTGTYFNAKAPNETNITTPTMQQFFMESGYRVASGGKVFHGNPGKVGDALFQRPRDPKPPEGKDNFNAMRAPNDGYALDVVDKEMGDYKVAQWASQEWRKVTENPLFMSVGFFRPHRPLQVPKSWFDQFPLESIRRPTEPDGVDDWADMPEFARRLARTHAHKPLHNGLSDHEYIVANDQWDATIRAYHASVAFVDRQIGRFLESLKKNPRGRETFVMLVSDHGWHLGEKQHWGKWTGWQRSTRVPLLLVPPSGSSEKYALGKQCDSPVGLIDLYPTLLDLCKLPKVARLDGVSLRPLLQDPGLASDRLVVTTFDKGNHALSGTRWRYIRYQDGSEELYDRRKDPNEWVNLVSNNEHIPVRKRLSKALDKIVVDSK